MRQTIEAVVPRGSTFLVAGSGDDRLLRLAGRTACRFPTKGNVFAADWKGRGLPEIVQLEAARSSGAQFLVLSDESVQRLERRPGFREHIESRFTLLTGAETECRIYDLRSTSARFAAGRSRFQRLIEEFEATHGRSPTILDWNTGRDLVRDLPRNVVITPPSDELTLPYANASIDVVALACGEEARTAEAHRVAGHAVVQLPENVEEEPVIARTSSGKAGPSASVSIIIPTYNGARRLAACLTALAETLPHQFRGEIVVVDDASTDDSSVELRQWAERDERIRVLANPANLGFLRSCNRAAESTTGDVLVFLNDDTIPLPNWLTPLLAVLEDPRVGAVGGQLLYPDGTLQEAGGVIYRDGTGANVGRGDIDPERPLYSFVREVDYCSGALLATRRSLFRDLGGFDPRYCPAYYEDTDYCFQVRANGLRTCYQPASRVIHLEGASSGTSVERGVKRHQALNRAKFAAKWRRQLAERPLPPGQYSLALWYRLAGLADREVFG